jgi:hypothetical protein
MVYSKRYNCIWLSASYVHTSQNVADIENRKFNENIEWKLNSNVFRIVTEKLGVTNFDLFASRLNTQWPTYASWKPDPGCKVVDAFSFLWTEFFYYAFPPFRQNGPEDKKRSVNVFSDCTNMANAKLVHRLTSDFETIR